MPTRWCRDALSREISEPVTDPFTGICYRNPCAAEEAGVVDWIPGCVLASPVYGSDGGGVGPIDTWAEDVWWSGGGGGRRHRPRRPGGRRGGDIVREPGGRGGLVRQPGHTLSTAGGGLVRQPDHTLSTAGGGIVRQPDQTLSVADRGGYRYTPPAERFDKMLFSTTPGYAMRPPTRNVTATIGPQYQARSDGYARLSSASPSTGYKAAPYTARATARIAAPRQSYRASPAPVRSLKGLGQTTTHPLATAIASVTANWATWIALGMLGLTIPPLLVGGIVRVKTKSWGKAALAGAATVAVSGAVMGGLRERSRATSTAPSGGSSMISAAYIR